MLSEQPLPHQHHPLNTRLSLVNYVFRTAPTPPASSSSSSSPWWSYSRWSSSCSSWSQSPSPAMTRRRSSSQTWRHRKISQMTRYSSYYHKQVFLASSVCLLKYALRICNRTSLKDKLWHKRTDKAELKLACWPDLFFFLSRTHNQGLFCLYCFLYWERKWIILRFPDRLATDKVRPRKILVARF